MAQHDALLMMETIAGLGEMAGLPLLGLRKGKRVVAPTSCWCSPNFPRYGWLPGNDGIESELVLLLAALMFGDADGSGSSGFALLPCCLDALLAFACSWLEFLLCLRRGSGLLAFFGVE